MSLRMLEISTVITEKLTLPASPRKDMDRKACRLVNAESHVFEAMSEVINSLCLAVRLFFMRICALIFIARTDKNFKRY